MKIEAFLNKSVLIPVIFVGRIMENQVQDELKHLDLSLLEALVVVSIFFEGGDCRPSELARTLNVSRAHVSIAIKQLLKKEFLSRKISSLDARFISLTLSASGRAKSQRLVRIFDALNEKFEKFFGVRKAEELAGALARFLETSS